MSQQLVKKNSNGRYSNVMPKSWIEAIKDKNTGQTLVEILQGFNMYFLPYNGNTSSTRCLVPTTLRKKGLWITYVKYDGNVYTEWYAASDIDDKSWGDSSNWRIGNNTLVGDITISANGNWVINGTESEFKAVGEKGNTPSIRVANNRLQVSYDLGGTYKNVTENPVYTQFRNYNNKIQVSTDLGATWTDTSDEIAAYFRWQVTTSDTQANNVGRLQISRDNKTWTNLSNNIANNLHISKYIGANEPLPTSGIAEGTIYAKGPTYAVEDTSNSNPIYRLWVYAWKNNILAWQDNGEFTSIAAGVVQETGSNENAVMSQKATTKAIHEILYDVSANNDGAVFESLQALLSSPNLSILIPASVRHGGMSIRFIQSSDNKYVQYRLMATAWSNIIADWQGVDNEPTSGSDNLVNSGGVAEKLFELEKKTFNIMSDVSRNFFNSDNDDFEYVTLANLEKNKTTMIIDYLGKVNCEFLVEGNDRNSFDILATNKETGNVFKIYNAEAGVDLPISFVNSRPDLELIDVKIFGTSKCTEDELKISIRKSSVIRELKESTERCEEGLSKLAKVTEGFDSANLYDPSKDVIGNLTTSGTIDATSTNFKVSDFIPVKTGIPIIMSVYSDYYSYDGVYSYGIWSEDKNTFFGRVDVTGEDSSAGQKTYLPSDNNWIRLKVGVNSTNIMVNYGNKLLPYEPYIEISAIDKTSRKAIGDIRTKLSNRDIKITKVNNNQILISQLQDDGSYIDWQWVHRYYVKDNIICNNHWTTEAIMHNGNTIGQSNINFVYEVSVNSFENENLYAGNGHGCCVMDFCKFFANGKEIDIASLDEPLYCSQFRILERSQCYAIDKTASSSSELGFPKLNNGVPVVAFIHYYDVVYTRESCEYNNYLTSKRDNTFFRRCYGAMLSCHLPYFTKVVIGNGNTYQYNTATDEKTPLFNSPTLASLMKIGVFIPNTISVVQYGDNYIFSTEMVHSDDTPNSHTNIEPVFGKNALVAGDKKEQKMYLQPIRTYIPSDPSWHDVLNNGDTIRVKVVKRIKYMP